MDVTQLIEDAQKWASDDLDEQTRAEMTALIEAGDERALREAMSPPLAFGTAGLRGVVGPGPARINSATIALASWALGDYLAALDSGERTVVVGYDARPDSADFARLCSEVLAGTGARVLLAPCELPTPIVAYLVRKQQAQAGVVVTASHNPRGQNGFKVFDGDGVQIVAPWDEEIAKRMDQPLAPTSLSRTSDGVSDIPGSAIDGYFEDVLTASAALVPDQGVADPIPLTYSPIHGVGLAATTRAIEALGGIHLSPVPEQAAPDGSFPTTPFPNPEEKGVLDLLLAQAGKEGAMAACAHDPDADRFSLCLPLGGPGLTRLSGDALGLLFADACLSKTRARNPEIISTIVSSPGATLLAERYGARMIRTLTGFKWLCHAALESDEFLFAYEEALGYCFGANGSDTAMDKDGILALLVAARLLRNHGGGEGLAQQLLRIYKDIGLWGSFGHSRRFEGPGGDERLATQMDRLRESPDSHIGGLLVTKRVDYREGAEQRPWYLGAQDLIRFDLEPDGDAPLDIINGRVFVRPSGTEAKLKAYVHLCSSFDDSDDYLIKSQAQESLAKAIARQVLRRPESILPPRPTGT